MKANSIPELSVLVHTYEALDAAAAEGADVVYLGICNVFPQKKTDKSVYSRFEAAVRSLHRQNRKAYIPVNTVFEEREAGRVFQYLKFLAGTGADGVLVHDCGIALMVKEHFPSLRLCASSMINIASARGVNFLSRHGFSRAALAREISLGEIRNIREQSNLELEALIYGEPCAGLSGLCLFSSYLGGKSANRGMCTQACRRSYYALSGDKSGCFFLPPDVQLVHSIPDFTEAGVNSFRIEEKSRNVAIKNNGGTQTGSIVAACRLVLDSLGTDRQEEALKKAGAIVTGGSRSRSKRYARLISGDLHGFKRTPSSDKAPFPQPPLLSPPTAGSLFPDGLYVQVSKPEDLYVIQSVRPVKAILNYKHDYFSRLIGIQYKPLPFTPKDMILSLDPFFSESQEADLSNDIPALIETGYTSFIANNLGHFSLLREAKAVIVGPWLGVFNGWAAGFYSPKSGGVQSGKLPFIVSPHENNRQNLEKTFNEAVRSSVFITIYARPPLLRFFHNENFVSSEVVDSFSDSMKLEFRLKAGSNASIIYPEKPFYIGDKVQFLKKSGFTHFILDFSSGNFHKHEYKDLIESINESKPVKDTTRFNWKNGFYHQQIV